jgi:hypothetical protein
MPGSNTTIIPRIVRFPESTLIVHDIRISDGLVRQIHRCVLALCAAGAEIHVDCRGRPHGCSAEVRARVGRIVFSACAESTRPDLAVQHALDRLSERIRAPHARDFLC